MDSDNTFAIKCLDKYSQRHRENVADQIVEEAARGREGSLSKVKFREIVILEKLNN